MSPPIVFVSYSHLDVAWKNILVGHLRVLEREGLLSVWSDDEIGTGDEWRKEIEQAMDQARVAVLLISKDFLTSSFIGDVEVPRLLARRRGEGMVVFPVRVENCAWGLVNWLAEIQARPRNGKALADLASNEVDRELADIAREIHDHLGRRPSASRVGRRLLHVPALVVLGFACLALVALLWLAPWEGRGERESPSGLTSRLLQPSVAVLTFANLKGLPELEWLRTALPEALAAKLAWDDKIRVVDRTETALIEIDAPPPQSIEIPSRDLERLRRLLAADHLVSGAFTSVGSISTVRLDLVLWDTRSGRAIARGRETREVEDWIALADGASERKTAFRESLKVPALSPDASRSLRAWLPADPVVARPWAEGLARLRRFDFRGARDRFALASAAENQPLALAGLAASALSLGDNREAAAAVERAQEADRAIPERSPSEPRERLRRELLRLAAQSAGDANAAAEHAEGIFLDLLPEDILTATFAAEALVDARRPEESLQILDTVRALPLADGHPMIERAAADALFAMQRYDEAIERAERARDAAADLKAGWQEALAGQVLASCLSARGNYSRATEELRRARAGFERVGDLRNAARTIETEAYHAAEINLPAAKLLFADLAGRYRKIGDRRQEVHALYALSDVLASLGRLDEARHRAAEASNLATTTWPVEDGYSTYFAAYQLHLEGRFAEAESLYDRAKRAFSRTPSHELYASVLANLGEIALARGNLTKAKELYSEALRLDQDAGAMAGVAWDALGLGRVSAVRGDAIHARSWFLKALTAVTPSGRWEGAETRTVVEAHLALVDLDLDSERPSKAERRAGVALEIARRTGFVALQSRAASRIARAHLAQGRLERARIAAWRALELAQGDFRAALEARTAVALAWAAAGKPGPALTALAAIVGECEAAGHVECKFETLLAQGVALEMVGRVDEGHHILAEVERRAADLGFKRVAVRAAALRL